MGDVAKDLTAGTVGGAAQLICGHPFDTIKVKLQSQPAPLPGQPPKYSGAIDAVKQTLAAEGPRGLYKGMGAPLATVAAFNAVLFTVRGQMETLLRSAPGVPLTVSQQVVCGAGAGVAVSFLACPTELIKCRLQAQSTLATTGAGTVAIKYGGPMDVARHVLQSEGGARGLFKGLVPTLAREVPGNAAMFGVYEALKQYLAGGQDTSSLGRGSLILAGGLAGASFWVSVYPTDVVKSVLQIDDYKNPKFSGSMDAFRKILKTEGVKGLYKGFGPAMARSVPANAACFLAYEVTRKRHRALWEWQPKKGDSPLLQRLAEIRNRVVTDFGSPEAAIEHLTRWSTPKGLQTSKAYEYFRPKLARQPWKAAIWKAFIPPKYSFILWLGMRGRLATRDRLGFLQEEDLCSLCINTKESARHLFFECPFSSFVWSRIRHWIGISRTMSTLQSATKWLKKEKIGSSVQNKARHLALACTVYTLWRHRNEVIFEGSTPCPEGLIRFVKVTLYRVLWTLFPHGLLVS
ncbi:UNVERIFIED_CONTAM: Mitochondrial carnitine/acylcarnitine carrier-like protein [Sesamum indicum]